MKKSLRLLLQIVLGLFVFSSASHAQLSVGLRGGVNFANLNLEGQDELSFKPKTRLNFAVLFNIPLSNTTSIQIEPGFSQRGGRLDNTAEGIVNNIPFLVESKGKLSINYIEMPVLFQYKPKIGNLEGIFSLGPEVRIMTGDMKLKQSVKQYINGEIIQENSTEISLNGTDAFKKFDYGLVGGVGVAYPLGTIKVFGEARYHFGLNNLNSSDETVKAYNRGASVHVGVLFPVGK
jgi:hypothetical protein